MIKVNNTYDIADTLSKFPRSKEKLEKWFAEHVQEMQLTLIKEAKGNEKEFKEKFEENKEQVMSSACPYFYYNGRDLYEFFDENEIFIENYEYQGKWGVDVAGAEMNDFSCRWDMEKAAFDKAFEMLEGKF